MWAGKGRSGIGDTNIQGTWEDWDGLSPNGRQYKNVITQETRNLSGQEYWNARKADYPSQETEVWKDGKANIAGFSDTVSKPKAAKKVDAFSSIMLADRNYSRLCGLSEALDVQLDNKEIDLESYCAARKNIDQRLAKAWARVQRERGWEGQEELLALEQHPSKGLELTLDFEPKTQRQYDYCVIPSNSVFAELQDGNSFKIIYTHVLTACKWLAKLSATGKQLVQEGLV